MKKPKPESTDEIDAQEQEAPYADILEAVEDEPVVAIEATPEFVSAFNALTPEEIREAFAKKRDAVKVEFVAPKPKPQVPTIGRQVHYHDSFRQGAILPATITAVHDDELVNLVVLDDSQNPPCVTYKQVKKTSEGQVLGTWEWPKIG